MHSGITTTEKIAADTETTATAPSTETSEGILTGSDSPREAARCEFVRILLARCALSSEEKPPVQEQGLPAYMQTVAQRPYLKYTLRLLRNGYVHVYHEPGEMFSFAVKKGVVEQGSLCPATPQENLTLYLRLPKEWGRALLAFSDAPGESFWARYADNAAARTARMHEIVWEGGKGLSSADTLCGPVSKIEEWVEEFRREPGFVRAPFEYEDAALREYYDPELGHFKPTQEPDAVIRRWRRTGYWIKKNKEQEKEEEGQKKEEVEDDGNSALPLKFSWLLVKKRQSDPYPPAETALAALNGHAPSGLAVLADPAGICMECAALYHAAVFALRDFQTWYAQPYALCESIQAIERGCFSRRAYIADENLIWQDITIELIARYKQGSSCIEKHLDGLLDFWLEWLNGTGRFSFSAVAKDYDTSSQTGSDGWDTALCLSTYEISAHLLGENRVRQEMEQDTPLARLLKERLKKSLWAQRKDMARDVYMGFPKLIDNFTGLLPHQRDITRNAIALPPYIKELLESMANTLCVKLSEKMEKYLNEDAYTALIKIFAIATGITYISQQYFLDKKIDFHIPLPGSLHPEIEAVVAADDETSLGFADKLKTIELTTVLLRTPAAYALEIFLPNRILDFLTAGQDDDSSQISSPGLLIVDRFLLIIAACSLYAAFQEQCTNKQRNAWGLLDISANVFGTVDMIIKSNFSVINKKYYNVVSAVQGTLRIHPETMKKISAKVFGCFATGFSVSWSIYSGITDFQKGEWWTGLGNFIMGAGAVFMLCPTTPILGIAITASGLFFVVFGKTDRMAYRVAKCYFGEKNYEKKREGKNSRVKIEKSTECRADNYGGILPFSYRRGYVPPDSLDNQDVPEFYTKRTTQIDTDLAAFELALLGLTMTAKKVEKKVGGDSIAIYISAQTATYTSSLEVTELKVFARLENYTDIPCKIPALSLIPVTCCFHNKKTSWFFCISMPLESHFSPQMQSYMVNILARQLVIKATVNFYYMSENDWKKRPQLDAAATLLLEENKIYRTIYGDDDDDKKANKTAFSFTDKETSDFRILKDYKLETVIDL